MHIQPLTAVDYFGENYGGVGEESEKKDGSFPTNTLLDC